MLMLKRFTPLIRQGMVAADSNMLKANCLPALMYLMKLNTRIGGNKVSSCRSFHAAFRCFAKGKNIQKNTKKPSYVNEQELAEWFDTEKLFNDFNKHVENFKQDLINHTTLRTAFGALESLKISYEGKNLVLQDLADIVKKNPKLYIVDMSAFPQALPTVLNTLRTSNLNVNVQQDGTKLFVPIPKVTREHREVLAKKAKVFFIKCKDNIKENQTKYTKKLKNQESISADTIKRLTDQLTALGDKYIKTAEDILKTKEKELLNVE